MGSSFHHVVGNVNVHYLARSFSSRRQRASRENGIGDGGLKKKPLPNKTATPYLSSFSLRFAKLRRRPLAHQRSLKLRCCEAGAAEAEVFVPAENPTHPSIVVPIERPVLQSFYEAEKPALLAHPEFSNPNAPSETAFEDQQLPRRVQDIPTTEAFAATKTHTASEQVTQPSEDVKEKNLLQQMWDIVAFAGPALGIWLSGPMMSLIDTAVVGNNSSLELAALGPGTILCDQTCYVFMFLSIATSNLIATSLAQKDESGAAQHLSRLLFVAMTCGIGMFVLTTVFAKPFLRNFVGPQNAGLVSAAFSYVQIRSFAWPIVIVGMVAQSASLGMQDSWAPLKVLAVASLVNLVGDILLCTFLGQGIAGAAWATTVSQYIAGFLMLQSLKKKGYSLALSVPSAKEFLHMVGIAAPVLLTMLSKVAFYSLITYLCTSLGAVTLGAHQVMIGIYSTSTVSGEPLCQTAQSFMPALIQGTNPNRKKAQMLLNSLLLIGIIVGLSLGCFALGFPWVFPQVFTRDIAIISQMRAVTVPFFCALVMTPPLLSLEGTLLAGRDLKFLSLSMVSCFIGGSAMLLACRKLGLGLPGFWGTLACFQSARFLSSFWRLKSAKSVLREQKAEKLPN